MQKNRDTKTLDTKSPSMLYAEASVVEWSVGNAAATNETQKRVNAWLAEDPNWKHGWDAMQSDPDWINARKRWTANPDFETNQATLIDMMNLKARYGVYDQPQLNHPEKLQWYLNLDRNRPFPWAGTHGLINRTSHDFEELDQPIAVARDAILSMRSRDSRLPALPPKHPDRVEERRLLVQWTIDAQRLPASDPMQNNVTLPTDRPLLEKMMDTAQLAAIWLNSHNWLIKETIEHKQMQRDANEGATIDAAGGVRVTVVPHHSGLENAASDVDESYRSLVNSIASMKAVATTDNVNNLYRQLLAWVQSYAPGALQGYHFNCPAPDLAESMNALTRLRQRIDFEMQLPISTVTPSTPSAPAANKPKGSARLLEGYRLASAMLADYPAEVPTMRRLHTFIKKHNIRTIKPQAKRLGVHVADFVAAIDKVRNISRSNGEPIDNPDEIERRKAALNVSRQTRCN